MSAHILCEVGDERLLIVISVSPEHDIGDRTLMLGIDVVLVSLQDSGCPVGDGDPDVPVGQRVIVVSRCKAERREQQGEHQKKAQCGHDFFHVDLLSMINDFPPDTES